MKTLIFKTSIIAMLLLLGSVAFAQIADTDGCKDSPLFKPLAKFHIQECAESYSEFEFVTGDNEIKKLYGTVLKILYSSDKVLGSSITSKMDVIKNYENEIDSMEGVKVITKTLDDAEWAGATFQFEKDSVEYWLGIYNILENPVEKYSFVLFTSMPLIKQEITEGMILKKINAGEAIPLNINFDFFETIIREESIPIIDELYNMLSDNPTLRIVVSGHTDNVGDQLINQILSEGRALSVKQALIEKGISYKRIEAIGYGEDRPIADNDTVEGRAKNRRVEIAKCVDQTMPLD